MATPAPLFLDAARLGAMSPTAQLAARDFARLAGEGLSTLYWEQFFRGQFFPAKRDPGLAHWHGVAAFRDAVRKLVAAPPHARVLFASRTTALTQAATAVLAGSSRRVLTTDSLWPPYRWLLDKACARNRTEVVSVPVRDDVLGGRISRGQLVQQVGRAFAWARCDGALLSSVSHDGVRLPLAPIIAALRSVNPDALIVIDGSQELAHVPVDLSHAPCDVYVAGAHKWLGAYQPLGIALLPQRRTSAIIDGLLSIELADPLFRYLQNLQGCGAASPPETVNLTPLVCASAAVHDVLQHPLPQTCRFCRQRSHVRRVVALARACGWRPLVVPPGLRTGILLLQALDPVQRWIPAPELQAQFSSAGVALTTYPGGLVRLSLPARRPRRSECSLLNQTLRTCGAALSWDLLEAAG